MMLTLPTEEEPLPFAVPPFHHCGQSSLHNLILYFCVCFKTAQQHCQIPVHIWDTQSKMIICLV